MNPVPPLRSKSRRWAAWRPWIVWSAFLVIISVRLLVPFDRTPRSGRMPAGWPEAAAFQERQRSGRPRTRVQPPITQVPADLWRIHIDVPFDGAAKLQQYSWNGWRGGRVERPEVLVTVREGGVTYTNVGLHLKGAAGSFRPFDDKPALTLNFSRHVRGQRFHGFEKISLNNSVQDPSYLSEAISRELFIAAGVPVPRADHATVILNGRDLGLYVFLEGYGKRFLKQHFSNPNGNLYDGGFLQDITSRLDTNSGDRRDDRSDLDQLAAAAEVSNSRERWDRLTQVLDMDRFLSFLAMEIMTCHWDGYALNKNNYRVFNNGETGKLVFMPHGLDQMFGVARAAPTMSLQPMMQGLVARAVSSTPEGRRQLFQRIGSLRTNVFLESKITNRVRELSRRIRPTLAAYAPDLAEEHDAQVAYLCQRIVERARSLTEQLSNPPESLQFDATGSAKLTGWAPRILAQPRGRVQFDQNDRDGKRELRIIASQGGGVASWRARALLETGRYVFEGRVRTIGVAAGGGAVLRVSGSRNLELSVSEGQWNLLRFPFEVSEPEAEVELICEFRSPNGEAQFDESSLRLMRE